MDMKDIERRLNAIVEAAVPWIPQTLLDEDLDLVRSGEPGVALENLLTQLLDHDVSLPAGYLREARTLAEAMGLDRKYWERLER